MPILPTADLFAVGGEAKAKEDIAGLDEESFSRFVHEQRENSGGVSGDASRAISGDRAHAATNDGTEHGALTQHMGGKGREAPHLRSLQGALAKAVEARHDQGLDSVLNALEEEALLLKRKLFELSDLQRSRAADGRRRLLEIKARLSMAQVLPSAIGIDGASEDGSFDADEVGRINGMQKGGGGVGGMEPPPAGMSDEEEMWRMGSLSGAT